MRPPATRWRIRGRTLDLSARPLVMGILNVTPDSFSDGGLYLEPNAALRRAREMADEGADLIDVGGESTRPGAASVSAEEEVQRVLPVVEGLVSELDVPISIDTTKSTVARQALAAGAHVVNDVGAALLDPEMAAVAADFRAGLVLMHMRGTPATMQEAPHYEDVTGEIGAFLKRAVDHALGAGVPREAIAVDPGIGFGKTWDHNWRLLATLGELRASGCPILIGSSRKGFLRVVVGEDRRDLATASVATAVVACMQGARIVRVHDVRAHRCAMEVVARVLSAEGAPDESR